MKRYYKQKLLLFNHCNYKGHMLIISAKNYSNKGKNGNIKTDSCTKN